MPTFTGTIEPSPLIGTGAMSSLLSGATMDAPPQFALVISGRSIGSGARTWVDEHPAISARNGLIAPTHGLFIFNRIHVEPRTKNLGYVLSDQTFQVEVWNAYMDRSQFLTDITINGPSGLQFATAPTFPLQFPGSESIVYTMKATTQGSPFVNNDVVWTFVGINPAGTDLIITGTRLVPFTISPDWSNGVVEGLGSLTDIIPAYDDTEQRVQVKTTPTRSMEFQIICVDERESQLLHALLYGWQSRPYGVPYWQEQGATTSAISIGAVTIPFVTTLLDFTAGGLAMLWLDASTWEVLTIQSISSSNIVITSGTRYAWPTGSVVVPMRLGRLSPTEEMTWESMLYSTMRVSFDMEAFG